VRSSSPNLTAPPFHFAPRPHSARPAGRNRRPRPAAPDAQLSHRRSLGRESPKKAVCQALRSFAACSSLPLTLRLSAYTYVPLRGHPLCASSAARRRLGSRMRSASGSSPREPKVREADEPQVCAAEGGDYPITLRYKALTI